MKKRIFSGIQPSGNLHIGNYLGAIKNWVELQNEYDSIFCVVDLHAITVPQNPEELRKRTIEIAKIYLAAGIDPEKSALFVQSQISEHTELAWILNTIAKMAELEQMTQFKDKANIEYEENKIDKLNEMFEILKDLNLKKVDSVKKISEMFYYYKSMSSVKKEGVAVGLFDYPVLMAADILLYDTEVVPVGEDQVQHIELARTLARRFNKKFGETFKVPEPFYVDKEGMLDRRSLGVGGRIMGLDDPTKKMSKSATSEYNYISLLDSEDDIRRKIKKAVTDSGTDIVYSEDKPALKNLINIHASFFGKSTSEVVAMYKGKGYADFKNGLAEVVVKFLTDFQEKFNKISDEEVLQILKKGAEKVQPIAERKMEKVKKSMGLGI